jgi:rhodanese-related sulfurtransferase
VCGLSRNAARYLLTHGFTPEHVTVYQDGLAGWEKEGLPVAH